MIVAFSGKIGSGKSAVSIAVAQALHLPQVSFGNYVRQQAQLRQLEPTRQHLQELGEHLLQTNALGFCRAVLDQEPNWTDGVVIDGIRHQTVLQLLRQLVAPQSLFHVHLTLEEEVRTQRLAQRPGEIPANVQEQYRAAAHPTEQQVNETLPIIADMVVDSAGSLETVVAQIMGLLTRRKV